MNIHTHVYIYIYICLNIHVYRERYTPIYIYIYIYTHNIYIYTNRQTSLPPAGTACYMSGHRRKRTKTNPSTLQKVSTASKPKTSKRD